MWVAIWLKLCSATEVGPLRCAHVVLIVVNNFFLLLLLLTGHTGGRSLCRLFQARHDDTQAQGVLAADSSSWMHLPSAAKEEGTRRGSEEDVPAFLNKLPCDAEGL